MYDYDVDSVYGRYLISMTVDSGRLYAMFVKGSSAAFDKVRRRTRSSGGACVVRYGAANDGRATRAPCVTGCGEAAHRLQQLSDPRRERAVTAAFRAESTAVQAHAHNRVCRHLVFVTMRSLASQGSRARRRVSTAPPPRRL